MSEIETKLNRRSVLTGLACTSGLVLAGCSDNTRSKIQERMSRIGLKRADPEFSPKRIYAAVPSEEFPLPAVPYKDIDKQFYRQRVNFKTKEKPGTVIVNTKTFFLHHVEPNGKAMRYGVGLGRQGFEWSGRAKIAWKRPWPTWTPPAEMIEREPHLEKWSAENGGMPPGLDNPLGARALYIFQDGVDTLYRLHGSPEHKSIGKAVSSGCVRLLNQDVIDLFNRVRPGSSIVVV